MRQVGHFTCATDMVEPHSSAGAEFEAAWQGGKPAAHFPAHCPGITHVPAAVTNSDPLPFMIDLHPAATLTAVTDHFGDEV